MIALAIDVPRTLERKATTSGKKEIEERAPSVVDLTTEFAKPTTSRGPTLRSTMLGQPDGSARLAGYRGHGASYHDVRRKRSQRVSHRRGEALIQVLDGSAMPEIASDVRPLSFPLPAAMLAVIARAVRQSLRFADGVMPMIATPFRGAVLELESDDRRTVARLSAWARRVIVAAPRLIAVKRGHRQVNIDRPAARRYPRPP